MAELYHPTNVNGESIGKQWIQIECPTPTTFAGFKMFCKTNNTQDRPASYKVAGSHNGTDFFSIYDTEFEYYGQFGEVKRMFNNPGPYRFYRLIVTATFYPETSLEFGSVNIQELMFVQNNEVATAVQFNELYESHHKLLNLLNTWILNGTLSVNLLYQSNTPIQEHW